MVVVSDVVLGDARLYELYLLAVIGESGGFGSDVRVDSGWFRGLVGRIEAGVIRGRAGVARGLEEEFGAGEHGDAVPCGGGGELGGVDESVAVSDATRDVSVGGDAARIVETDVGERVTPMGGAGGCDAVAGAGIGVVRGKNYAKNRARKKRVAQRRLAVETVVGDGVRSESHKGVCPAVSGRVGRFSGCSEEVQRRLVESQAAMYVVQNELNAAKAEAALKRLELEKNSRVGERQFELRRQTLEDKLQKVTQARLGTPGFVESIVSSGLSEVFSVPKEGECSVSPSSSISLAEERQLRSLVSSLAEKVKSYELKEKRFEENRGRKEDADAFGRCGRRSPTPCDYESFGHGF